MKNKVVELSIDEMIFGGESINNNWISEKPYGYHHSDGNVVPVRAEVSHLKSLKEGVRINNPTPSYSF